MIDHRATYQQCRRYCAQYYHRAILIAARLLKHVAFRMRLFKKWRKRVLTPEWVLAWSTVFIFLATVVNVAVAALQWDVLRKTDTASRRAWIGPSTASITSGVEKDKGIAAQVQYLNTGREPAFDLVPYTDVAIFSLADWENGSAARVIMGWKDECLAANPPFGGTRMAFPSSSNNSFYHVSFNTDDHVPKIVVSDALTNGNDIFVIRGCFMYRSAGEHRHTSFCFFYQAKLTNLPNLSICTVGNDAD